MPRCWIGFADELDGSFSQSFCLIAQPAESDHAAQMIGREDFHRRLLSVAEENQLKISPEAEELIFKTLSALEKDPNPNWPVEATNQLANRYVDNIELFVRAYSGRSPDEWYRQAFPMAPFWKFRVRRRRDVHYFDVLHFIAENLSWLNPFPKDREESR